MNLITQTYGADEWQLVPRVVTHEMMKAGQDGLRYCTEILAELEKSLRILRNEH